MKLLMTIQSASCDAERRQMNTNDNPWHGNNDNLECCLPSCFNTSLVFESLGEDMIVVVMEDEMEVAAAI